MNTFLFRGPTYIKYGCGTTKEMPGLCQELHIRHPLFVIGNHVRKSDLFSQLEETMIASGITYEVFSDVPTEPTVTMVDRATAIVRSLSCDGIISIGGGSIIDTAKAMSVLAVNAGSALDYMFGGSGQLNTRGLPLICVPTTAGSGSEVTASSVILKENSNVKLSITHNYLFPCYAIIDPEWQLSMPHKITISTGMDAMTHAIEAFTSTTATPLSDLYARQAISIIAENIKRVAENPDDVEARGNMALASTMAALAFINGGLGAVHGISQSIGGIAHVPHGIGNAILLPYVMELNCNSIPIKFAEIAQLMSLPVIGKKTMDAALCAVDAIWDLTTSLGIPSSIKEVGITPEMFPSIIKETMDYRLLHCNPAKITPDILNNLLSKSYNA